MGAIIIFLVIVVAILFIIGYMVISDTKYLIWFRSKTVVWNNLKRKTATIIRQKTPLLEYPMLVYLNFDSDIRRIYTEEGYSAYATAINKKLNDVVDNLFNKPISQTDFRSEEEQEIDEISKLDKESGYKEEEIEVVPDSRNTPIMSAFDIVNETIEYYSQDVTRRACDKDGDCVYLTKDGRRCALSRCLVDKAIIPSYQYEQTIAVLLQLNGQPNTSDGLDKILKREYRGHSIHFWTALQSLHDGDDFWNDEITEAGQLKAEEIIRQFS